jgi:hypothetical protein
MPLPVLTAVDRLRSQLFFEYTSYTPFLFSDSWTVSGETFKSRRRARLGAILKSTNTNTSAAFDYKRLTLLSSLTPSYLLVESLYDLRSGMAAQFSVYNFQKNFFFRITSLFRKTVGSGLLYLKGLFIMFFIDACLTDDEPL